MKNIKKFEQFLKENKDLSSKVPTYSESDAYIADILDELDINYRIGKDSAGNEGVFLITLNHTDTIEIYSFHPKLEHSAFNITYNVDGEIESFKTHDLRKSLEDILKSYNEDSEYLSEDMDSDGQTHLQTELRNKEFMELVENYGDAIELLNKFILIADDPHFKDFFYNGKFSHLTQIPYIESVKKFLKKVDK